MQAGTKMPSGACAPPSEGPGAPATQHKLSVMPVKTSTDPKVARGA